MDMNNLKARLSGWISELDETQKCTDEAYHYTDGSLDTTKAISVQTKMLLNKLWEVQKMAGELANVLRLDDDLKEPIKIAVELYSIIEIANDIQGKIRGDVNEPLAIANTCLYNAYHRIEWLRERVYQAEQETTVVKKKRRRSHSDHQEANLAVPVPQLAVNGCIDDDIPF